MPAELETTTATRITEEPPRRNRLVSPELVLVDEDLAEWARLRLREDVVAAEAGQRSVFEPAGVAPLEEVGQRAAGRKIPLVVYVIVALPLLAALIAYVRASAHSPSQRASSAEAGLPASESAVTPSSAGLVFAWPSVPDARFYSFSLSRGSTTIFRARQAGRHRLVLPNTWFYGGRRFTLSGGRYRWRVLAFVGPPAQAVPQTVVAAPLLVNGRS